MYICSICNRQFKNKEDIAKHSLKCWRENNPYHKSKTAPHSSNRIERTVNKDILNFFASFQKGV